MGNNSMFDEILKGMRAGISDIREKLEEVTWGQPVTDSHTPAEITVQQTAAPSFQDIAKEVAAHERQNERGKEQEHER